MKLLSERIVIIYYHGVVEKKRDPLLERNFLTLKEFKQHICLLKKFRIIDPVELEYSLTEPSGEKPRLLITVDDGYYNNRIIHEILSKEKIRWSLFISTGAIDNRKILWTTEIALLLLFGNAVSIEAYGRKWPLDTRRSREETFNAIRVKLKKEAASEKDRIIKMIRQQFPAEETERLFDLWPSFRMLSWDDIVRLSSDGVAINSHGVDHEIHHVNQPSKVRMNELKQSKDAIEERLKKKSDVFAFPNGDFMEKSVEELGEAGYKLGLLTDAALENNKYLLPRLSANSAYYRGSCSEQVHGKIKEWTFQSQT